MKEYKPAKKRIVVSIGESMRIIRELQERNFKTIEIRAETLQD
jgi:hypothetical protein